LTLLHSGQGPYYRQATYFLKIHPEKIKPAIKRYREQTLRVVCVLDKALEGKTYLVGDKVYVSLHSLANFFRAGED
jgi:glutathione S-transferase